MKATKRRSDEATKGNTGSASSPPSLRRCVAASLPAFTLVELLVVIGIIAILIGILVPVVSKMRVSAQRADTANFITQLTGAIERYHADFNAYPGPVPNVQIGRNNTPPQTPDWTIRAVAPDGRDLNRNMTGAENLVLGLLGGLFYDTTSPTQPFKFDMKRTLAGQGPQSLNPSNPKQYPAYIEPRHLFTGPDPVLTTIPVSGFYADDAARCLNTAVPEFLDQFAAPMPILYLRANAGATGTVTLNGATVSKVVSDGGVVVNNRDGQYDLSQIGGYTKEFPGQPGQFIGVGKTVKPGSYKNSTFPAHGLVSNAGSININSSLDKSAATYSYPYEPYAYFTNPAIANTARQKDGYILISAGADRVYGTEDDITNFGSVVP